MKILVAGASGMLGRLVVSELLRRAEQVRTLSRKSYPKEYTGSFAIEHALGDLTDRQSLISACKGIDIIISCAGASMDIKNFSDRSTFMDVDYLGNLNLLNVAKDAGVKKFIYVSVAGAQDLIQTEYCRAHLLFEEALAASGMDHTIVQPSGFFYFMGEIAVMARKGRGMVIGDGNSKTNPIHEQDVAQACADAIRRMEQQVAVGGPEIFTRKEIVELAFSTAGRTPSIFSISRPLFLMMAWFMKFINPRIHALLEFGAAVSTTDAVVPMYGKRRLNDYFSSIMERSKT